MFMTAKVRELKLTKTAVLTIGIPTIRSGHSNEVGETRKWFEVGQDPLERPRANSPLCG